MSLVCQRSRPTLCYDLAKKPLFQGLDLFMIWPFLSQHNVPYQQDELWLNLEERIMSQHGYICLRIVKSKAGDESMSDCFLRWEMLSAILLLFVLIHCELMPRGELINNEQKIWESIRLIFYCLNVCSVQDNTEELLVTLRITWWGLSVMGDVQTTWRVAQ